MELIIIVIMIVIAIVEMISACLEKIIMKKNNDRGAALLTERPQAHFRDLP